MENEDTKPKTSCLHIICTKRKPNLSTYQSGPRACCYLLFIYFIFCIKFLYFCYIVISCLDEILEAEATCMSTAILTPTEGVDTAGSLSHLLLEGVYIHT